MNPRVKKICLLLRTFVKCIKEDGIDTFISYIQANRKILIFINFINAKFRLKKCLQKNVARFRN